MVSIQSRTAFAVTQDSLHLLRGQMSAVKETEFHYNHYRRSATFCGTEGMLETDVAQSVL